jgi:hypothetical protein
VGTRVQRRLCCTRVLQRIKRRCVDRSFNSCTSLIRVWLSACLLVNTHTHEHTHTHTHAHARTHVHTHTHTHARAHTHTHTHTHTARWRAHFPVEPLGTRRPRTCLLWPGGEWGDTPRAHQRMERSRFWAKAMGAAAPIRALRPNRAPCHDMAR